VSIATLDLEGLVRVLTRTHELPVVEVALGVAAAGVPVLAVAPGSKGPLLTVEHTGGCETCRRAGLRPALDHGATVDPEAIRSWYAAHPDAGVGMRGHPRLLRGDGDFADAAALKGYRSKIHTEPMPFEAHTPGGQYRRRYLHTVADGVALGVGGGTPALGVSWYGASGYVVVAGVHPNGQRYPRFIGEKITPVPAAVLDALTRRRVTGAGAAAHAANRAAVEQFLDRHTRTERVGLLAAHRKAVATAPEGERHHTAVRHLTLALRDALGGCYPARVAVDSIRDALGEAGWGSDRLGGEYDAIVAWAVAQVDGMDPGVVRSGIEYRLRQAAGVGLHDDRHDPGDSAARDLTLAELDALLSRTAAEPSRPDRGEDRTLAPIDWETFWQRDHQVAEWLVEPIIPAGRMVSIVAPAKLGKSLLALELAACAATGRAVLHRPAGDPLRVVYLDYEMAEADLFERLSAMGFGPDDDLSGLAYYSLPALAPLDTPAGGRQLLDIALEHQAEVVVVDTLQRAVAGEENAADTIRGFWRHTGAPLKREGVAVARLDHLGKDTAKGARGTSAKADDVDVEWTARLTQDGIALRATRRRMGWVPETVALKRTVDPLRHSIAPKGWAPGTKDLAELLDHLGVPPEVSFRKARDAVRSAGHKASSQTLADALQWRKRRHLEVVK
jgi:hypothetical protein